MRRTKILAYRNVYTTEYLDVHVNEEKKLVQIETASSGYRPRYVTVDFENLNELNKLIEALKKAREFLK
jgi:hypothetical protein